MKNSAPKRALANNQGEDPQVTGTIWKWKKLKNGRTNRITIKK